MSAPTRRPAPPRTRRPKHSLRVEALPAGEPIDDLDRWVTQYAEAIARLEGIPLRPGAHAA